MLREDAKPQGLRCSSGAQGPSSYPPSVSLEFMLNWLLTFPVLSSTMRWGKGAGGGGQSSGGRAEPSQSVPGAAEDPPGTPHRPQLPTSPPTPHPHPTPAWPGRIQRSSLSATWGQLAPGQGTGDSVSNFSSATAIQNGLGRPLPLTGGGSPTMGMAHQTPGTPPK